MTATHPSRSIPVTTVQTSTSALGGPVAPRSSALTPLDSSEIRLTGGYWFDKQQLNAHVVLRHCEDWMERIGWTANFDRAASSETGWEHSGIEFVDSEVYKLLEGMAWELGRSHDADLAARYDRLVSRVASAQDDDGYLHTSFGRPWQPARYSNLEWGHELYSFGHLIQAAVAAARSGLDSAIVDVARRLADHLWEAFGPEGRVAVCGHPEIEVALVELGRALDEPRHVELARLFVERRGHGLLAPIEYGPEYFQDDVPVRDADVLRGHAVRALYLAAGALDVAVETDDAELADAVRRQWEATVARRTYVTGGMGSHHQDESYGADFELPPDRAYSETCAGIASNMLSWRLLLQDADPRYADLIERTLLNNVMASPRDDGRAFFYTNTLHQRTDGVAPDEAALNARALSSLRAPWFEVSCCPTNVARTLASVESTFATTTPGGLQLHQYGDYDVDTALADGTVVAVSVRSGYPYAGDVTVTWREDTGREVELDLRIPSWAGSARVGRGGGVGEAADVAADGGAADVAADVRVGRTTTVSGRFRAGDVVTVEFPLEARWVTPDPRIDAVRGQVAVQRGPLVLVLESTDLPSGDVNDVVVDTGATLETTATGASVDIARFADETVDWPYGESGGRVVPLGRVDLVPYASWANRGPSTMRVWLPTA
ncbi:glycoside hydrolase family 127 protein [Frigoribacterium sp. CFBP9030]|uniref:glycoside hydrolase family 127 protein n=1 Tax=Frigoribacterium sp. CFBP9030 TaxID=3096537 RepID=UPI002A69F7E4|nr:beta-L-arabinofuranosidase domain-containing protein [Frigoribacterium sp. CFBP9030]MDY0891573.1 glycoside hydrolase family 127 protein [Frigoribacterium sp. CFBP9030]